MKTRMRLSILFIGLLLSACSPSNNEPVGNEAKSVVLNDQSADANIALPPVGQQEAASVSRSSPAQPIDKLPAHEKQITALSMKSGMRVQVNVNTDISKPECLALIAHYKARGAPDGQISVRKPSAKIDGILTPWCVENFDGEAVRFNDNMF